jgi:aryl-alcohol dehydrogenase-like predicted oxidoreductase
MNLRPLGRSPLHIAPFVLGTNVFRHTVDDKTAFAILDAFYEAGFNMIDTANSYTMWAPGNKGGESEEVIGNWMKDRNNRSKVLIATKVGWEITPEIKGLTRAQIVTEVENSLRRLHTDYIDLYQSHRDDPDTPQEETLAAYSELVQQGKVRVIGASNYTAERLTEAMKISSENDYPRYESLQPLYNLYDREEYEQQLEPFCVREEIGVIPYFSIARGFLTGKYRGEEDVNKSVRGNTVRDKYFNDRGWKILKALDEVSAEHNATPVQIALAWLIHRPSITAPISSATSVDQLTELTRSAAISLDQEEISKLDEASKW